MWGPNLTAREIRQAALLATGEGYQRCIEPILALPVSGGSIQVLNSSMEYYSKHPLHTGDANETLQHQVVICATNRLCRRNIS